jgi:hypothetical protein
MKRVALIISFCAVGLIAILIFDFSYVFINKIQHYRFSNPNERIVAQNLDVKSDARTESGREAASPEEKSGVAAPILSQPQESRNAPRAPSEPLPLPQTSASLAPPPPASGPPSPPVAAQSAPAPISPNDYVFQAWPRDYREELGPTEQMAALDRAIETLPVASLAYSAPKTMQQSTASRVEVLLQPGITVEALANQLSGAQQVGRTTIPVAATMVASLTGTAFEITSIAPLEQPLRSAAPTRWMWDIRAKEGGIQNITLTMSAKMSLGGLERTRLIETYSSAIEVLVEPKPWYVQLAGAISPWKEILGAVAAIGSAIFYAYKYRRKIKGIFSRFILVQRRPPDKTL